MSDHSPTTPTSAQANLHDDVDGTLTVIEAERLVRRWRAIKRTAKICVFGVGPFVLVLAAIAIPSMHRFPCRSHQSEAKTQLKGLYVAEEAYRAEFDTYVDDFGLLEATPWVKRSRNYWFVIPKAVGHAFDVYAIGKPNTPVAGDHWSINQDNVLTNHRNVCAP